MTTTTRPPRPRIGARIVRGLPFVAGEAESGITGKLNFEKRPKRADIRAAIKYTRRLAKWHGEHRQNGERK